jgi:hypothetical protein
MKTTLVIDDHVMTRLREEAAREGVTISKLVEAALRRFLDVRDQPKSRPLAPLPTFRGGEFLVDIVDRDALYDAMEER